MSNSNNIVIFNVASTIIVKGIAFFSMPIFARLLGPEQYGVLSVFNSWVVVLACVMTCGMEYSVGPGYYYFKKCYYNFRSSTLFHLLLVSSVVSVSALYFGKLVKYDNSLLVLLILTSFSQGVIVFVRSVFIFEKKPLLNFCFSVLLALSSVVLAIVFINITFFDTYLIARIVGNTISYIFFSGIMCLYILRNGKLSLDFKFFKFACAIGAPMIVHALSQNAITQSDRIMMQAFGVDNGIIGIYSLVLSFCMVLDALAGALLNAWIPFYYDGLSAIVFSKVKERVNNLVELFSACIVVFLLASKDVFELFAGSKFLNGVELLPAFAIIIFMSFLCRIPVSFEHFYKKTTYIALGTIFTASINILFNFYLIPIYEIYGAIVSSIVSLFFQLLIHMFLAQRTNTSFRVLHIRYITVGIFYLTIGVLLFYFLKSLVVIRFLLGICICVYEVRAIISRKVIF